MEWKWDGIRAQLVKRDGQIWVWSRGEELVSERFPELCELARCLPDGTVIDGEILVWKHAPETPAGELFDAASTGEPSADGFGVQPFALLQQRIGRKNLTAKVLQDAPVAVLAYDLLEWQGHDLRSQPQRQRRAELEREREAQRQRELLARQAEQQLQLYRQLRRETRKPEELYGRILSDASYSPFSGGGYAAMMQGRAQRYSQIVHIDGKTDGGWKIDYPYAAVLDTRDSEQDADEGWFLVKGEARLDASRKDEQNLPLTLISANTLQACSEKGCADLRDPLKLARHEIGDPDWTPEEAKSLIQQAWPERAELQGDDE